MQHPETDTGSSSLYRGKKERIVSAHILLMTGNAVSHNPEILASRGNSASCVPTDGSRNMSSALTG